MAKRRRLTPPRPDYLDTPVSGALSGPFATEGFNAGSTRASKGGSDPGLTRAPIAQIASEAATLAALDEVSGELRTAREAGRMLLALPLAQVRADHLIRDRLAVQDEADTALTESLRARGQQTAIEVEALPDGGFGLICGWRRLMALHALHAETGKDRFATVLAVVRRPGAGAESYVAMVEENEIRAGLSFYERARIVMRAVEAEVFATEQAALQSLFSTASYAKRSKVKSFIPIVAALDRALRFPTHISERLGLELSRALAERRGFAARASAALEAAAPATPEAELIVLQGLLKGPTGSDKADRSLKSAPGVHLRQAAGRVVLEGAAVDAAFVQRLRDWIATQT